MIKWKQEEAEGQVDELDQWLIIHSDVTRLLMGLIPQIKEFKVVCIKVTDWNEL